ncbi:MAG TPA: hypothetical protein VJZ27_11245, partial [Aggregatilineales bacterium]|nr:hypothetical protein [Aggregatilineales bacterium]
MENKLLSFSSAFHFTDADIKANRRGRLSRWQRGYLWRRWIITALGGLLLTLTPILLAWILIIWSTGQRFSDTLFDNRAVIGYLVGIILGVIYSAANFKGLLLLSDLMRSRVIPVRGKVEIWGQYLLIGQYRFVVDEEAIAVVQSGLQHRV